MTRVKVCGVTRREDADLAVELGASAVGFVFWRGSPRFVEPDVARPIARALPAFVAAVGVFVDEAADVVDRMADHVGLTAVQLHGHETPAYCTGLRHRVIRAVGVDNDAVVESVATWPPEVTVLLDAHDPARRGGTGRTVSWDVAASVAASRPTILAGGLRPGNVGEAVRIVHPYAVDVSSGVEASPGVKDPARMRAFFEAVQRAESR